MRVLSLLAFCILASPITEAQSQSFSGAYIVTLAGDTLRGEYTRASLSSRASSIRFRVFGQEEYENLTADDIHSYVLSDGTRFVAARVFTDIPEEPDVNDSGILRHTRGGRIATAQTDYQHTGFLREVIAGPLSLFQFHNGRGERRYYITFDRNDVFVGLFETRSRRASDERGRLEPLASRPYIQVLTDAFRGCAEMRDVRVAYRERALATVVQRFNTCVAN
ncbi:hypothetical protein BH23BAC4_BH23BAC4_10960 [soil metagenome]